MSDLGSRVICLRWDVRLSITLVASVALSVGVCVPESINHTYKTTKTKPNLILTIVGSRFYLESQTSLID